MRVGNIKTSAVVSCFPGLTSTDSLVRLRELRSIMRLAYDVLEAVEEAREMEIEFTQMLTFGLRPSERYQLDWSGVRLDPTRKNDDPEAGSDAAPAGNGA